MSYVSLSEHKIQTAEQQIITTARSKHLSFVVKEDETTGKVPLKGGQDRSCYRGAAVLLRPPPQVLHHFSRAWQSRALPPRWVIGGAKVQKVEITLKNLQ